MNKEISLRKVKVKSRDKVMDEIYESGAELLKITSCDDTKFLLRFVVSLLRNYPIESSQSYQFAKGKKSLFY